jgi:hypothetical protein
MRLPSHERVVAIDLFMHYTLHDHIQTSDRAEGSIIDYIFVSMCYLYHEVYRP